MRSVELEGLAITWSCCSEAGSDGRSVPKENQDAWVAAEHYAARHELLLGVFDGHGVAGRAVSHAVVAHLPGILSQRLDFYARDAPRALQAAFPDCNAIVLALSDGKCELSGSTGVVAHVATGGVLTVASVGDSRCILGRTAADASISALQLNEEHTPALPGESERVVAHGGRIAPFSFQGECVGPPRVWLGHRNVPGLCMTRAFGDRLASSVGVNCKPHVRQVALCREDVYLVVMSDGVFEFLSNQEIVERVHRLHAAEGLPLDEVACRLVQEARQRWVQEEGDCIDDCTMLIARLDMPPIEPTHGRRAQGAVNPNVLDAHRPPR